MADLPSQYKGDKLFKGDLDWWHNAVVDEWSHESDHDVIGYRKSADLLFDHVKRRPQDRHYLVFPIVFLSRQYLELRMKDILTGGYKLLGKKGKYPGTHNLCDLWSKCRPVLERYIASAQLKSMEKYIREFSKRDP